MSFKETRQQLRAVMHRLFPAAEDCHEYNIDGWRVKVQDRPANWKGTFDPEHFYLLPAEKKAGITTHIWDPRDPQLMDRHRDALTAAGFKVMVGCIQWNRKAPYPVEAVEAVLQDAAQA